MRAPRTLRTALVATGVTVALGASAAGAFAQPAAASEGGAPTAHTVGHGTAGRVHVKTVKLADKVSRAKVYRTGKHRYEAEIWAKGLKYGTLTAKGRTVHADPNGLHIALHPNGKVTSWVERARPKPKPAVQRVLVASAPLADDTSTVNLYKITAHHYEADIYVGATKIGTLVAKGHAAHGENNGLHILLRPDGQLSSWTDQTPTPQPEDNDQPTPATPTTPDTPSPTTDATTT
ncbi:hypothetical protein [Streptomyces sp. NPDC057616]|uniref:hypothetical protein n=1 Tax=Streptomyces sp. NPDC057616 TaxID=3346183 RepID=UPI00367BF6C4